MAGLVSALSDGGKLDGEITEGEAGGVGDGSTLRTALERLFDELGGGKGINWRTQNKG